MKRIFVLVMLLLLGLTLCSCNSDSSLKKEVQTLCPRNVFSRNGVDTVYHYSFDTKEGEVDMSSKKLYSIEQYDSLGNVIYYKGGYYPAIKGLDIVTYHYEIRDELNLPWNTTYTYKMEYRDSSLLKASMFDDNGKYVARIEKYVKDNVVEDSVYVRDRLIYVQHIVKDIEGRDSISRSYDNKYGNQLKLAEEKKSKYSQNGNVLREDFIRKSRSFLYEYDHKYDTSEGHYELSYDGIGRLIKSDYGGYVTTYTYDDKGNTIETITYSDYRKTKTLVKNDFYENGLTKSSYTFADMTICESYSEYEYVFYPYSTRNK